MSRPILFVNRRNDGNIGDALSSPLRYFNSEFAFAITYELHLGRRRLGRAIPKLLRDNSTAVIVGGGGLIGQPFFEDDIAFWTRGNAPAILWGAGHNSHNLLATETQRPQYEDYAQLSRFALIGVRDHGTGFTWVPCASCMDGQLSLPTNERAGTVFLLHRDLRGETQTIQEIISQSTEATVVFNDCGSEELFGALRSARRIVTNSYHAAYLGTLLRKPVVCIGGGSKVLTLKHAVPVAPATEWSAAFERAVLYPHALQECRDANVDFCRRVGQFMKVVKQNKVTTHPVRNPLEERAADVQVSGSVAPAIRKHHVPKVIHFIFGLSADFGGKPFNVMHKVAVLSALEKIKPEEIIFHHHYRPDNQTFLDVAPLMTLNKIAIPTEYRGRELKHFAHKADIVRLNLLAESGGIYMDLDTVSVNSFDCFLQNSFTIGLQGLNPVEGLCNAVMLSAPKDPFITEWLRCYERFSGKQWDRFSVHLPYIMWRSGKWSINVQPYDKFHWPHWDPAGLRKMFEETHTFGNAVCHHLWESFSYKKYFGGCSDEEATIRIREARSTYGSLARPYL